MALFDIVRKNLTEDNPNSPNPADLLIVPEQTSQGIEAGFNFAASDALQIYGNAAVLNAETDTGATPTATPEQTYNLGVAWDAGPVRILADARYVGRRVFATNPVPSYTVVDASVRWDVGDALGLTLKVDNLFDELYASGTYSGSWIVGKRKTAALALDHRF